MPRDCIHLSPTFACQCIYDTMHASGTCRWPLTPSCAWHHSTHAQRPVVLQTGNCTHLCLLVQSTSASSQLPRL